MRIHVAADNVPLPVNKNTAKIKTNSEEESAMFRQQPRLHSPLKTHLTIGQNRKNHRKNSHPIIHFPTREGVSEESERAKRAGWSKQTSERCEQTNERVAQNFHLGFWLIWPTVHSPLKTHFTGRRGFLVSLWYFGKRIQFLDGGQNFSAT